MIEDIVALPRRLQQFPKTEVRISSEVAYGLPISSIPCSFGVSGYDDSAWCQYGNSISMPTGKDTYFRYKIIELTPSGIVEYFVLADSPINILKPRLSRKVPLHCLWVTLTDYRSRLVSKYVLWRNIREMTRYLTEDNVVDAPVEAVIADELRRFAEVYAEPRLMKEIDQYPKSAEDVLISEVRFEPESGIDKLSLLLSNIREYHRCFDANDWGVEPTDVLRGLELPREWSNLQPLKVCSILPKMQWGSVTLEELETRFSPLYGVHRFQQNFRRDDLNPYTELTIESEDKRRLFDVLKYVERLPYSEFDLEMERDVDRNNCVLFDRYQIGSFGNARLKDSSLLTSTVCTSIRPVLNTGFPNWKRIRITRSWAEEMYMTVEDTNGRIERFYFDIAAAALCSRSLIRDYAGPTFAVGL